MPSPYEVATVGLLTSTAITGLASYISLPFIASNYADQNKWFTRVPEGYARAIKHNGKFHTLYMSFADHVFRGEVSEDAVNAALQEKKRLENIIEPRQRVLENKWKEIKNLYDHLKKVTDLQHELDQAKEDKREQDISRLERELHNEDGKPIPEIKADIKHLEEECSRLDTELCQPKQEYAELIIPHKWDVIPGHHFGTQELFETMYFGWTRGLHFIGIPNFYEVHTYNFVWRSWELTQKADGTWGKDAVEHGKNKKGEYVPLQHILLSDDVYYAKVYNAETVDGIPVNMAILLTIQVQNPYKALFKIEQWLQATENHVETAAVQFIRTKSFEEISQAAGDTPNQAAHLMNNQFQTGLWQQRHFTRNEYGVYLKQVRILNVDPSTERGQKFRDLLLASTFQEREGKANLIKAQYGKQVRVTEAEGVADAINIIADAEHNQTDKVEVYAAKHGATEALKYRRMSDSRSPVNTWVDGGGANINLTPQPRRPIATQPNDPAVSMSQGPQSPGASPTPEQARPEQTSGTPSDPTQKEGYVSPAEGYDPAAGYNPPSQQRGSNPKKNRGRQRRPKK